MKTESVIKLPSEFGSSRGKYAANRRSLGVRVMVVGRGRQRERGVGERENMRCGGFGKTTAS